MRIFAWTIIGLAMCGYSFASGPTGAQPRSSPEELKTLADSVRPALAEAGSQYAPALGDYELSVGVGLNALGKYQHGHRTTAIGACSGASLLSGDDDVLVGAYTAAPTPTTSGFVNIANKLCFWRETGKRVNCPAPEPDCTKDPHE